MKRKIVCNGILVHLWVSFLWTIGLSKSETSGKVLQEEELGEIEVQRLLLGSLESFIGVVDWSCDRLLFVLDPFKSSFF